MSALWFSVLSEEAKGGGGVLGGLFGSESCVFGGLFGCPDFAVFDSCMVLELENLVERGIVVEKIVAHSASLKGECSFVLGQASGSGVLGLGERHRAVLAGDGCRFVNDGRGMNEYKLNVSYSWESNRAVGGFIEGTLLSKGSSGSGDGVCSAGIAGVCGHTNNSCAAGTFRNSPGGWTCEGLNGGRNATCKVVDGICDVKFESCQAGAFRDILDNNSHYLWSCKGLSGGANAENCSLDRSSLNPSIPLNRQCGTGRDNCTAGIYSDAMDNSTHYLWKCGWSCDGRTGDLSNCSMPRNVNGTCGNGKDSCTSGTMANAGGNSTHHLWECKGLNNGSNATCNIRKSVDGTCGNITSRCLTGVYSDSLDNQSHYLWKCKGLSGGSDAKCSEINPVDAVCGNSSYVCERGNPTYYGSPYESWFCIGSYGGRYQRCDCSNLPGQTISCDTFYPPVNGACNSTALNSCLNGTYRDIADTNTKHKWSCDGFRGGSNALCDLGKNVDGACRTDYAGCLYGTYKTGVNNNTHYRWECNGLNGGSNASCERLKPVNGVCDNSKLSGCLNGTYSDLADTIIKYKWSCEGLHGGSSANCSKAKTSNGICGANKDVCEFGGVSGRFADAADTNDYSLWNCELDGTGGTGLSCSCSYCPPVEGGWSDYGSCHATDNVCSSGIRYRACTNPAPACGGEYCTGIDRTPCYLDSCTFESTWDTTKTSLGSSNNKSITLPLHEGGNYNFTVHWGDGTTSKITSWNSTNKTHTYTSSGTYALNISGQIEGFRFDNQGDKLKLINITKTGSLKLGNLGAYFYGAANLINITGNLNLKDTTNLSQMFMSATKFNGNISGWNTSSVTNMSTMFAGTPFNQPLNNWDTSSVTNMEWMFAATPFNQTLNNWDTSSVRNMQGMFWGAYSFNQNISGWNVCRVSNFWWFDHYTPLWNPEYKPVFGQPCHNYVYYFESTWDTTKTSSGSSNSKSIMLPLHQGGKYNFTVHWGDGTSSKITSWNSANKTHTYAHSGRFTLIIVGQIEGFRFDNRGDKLKLINIKRTGPLKLGNLGGYFYGARNLVNITGNLNLTGTTNFQNMFREATRLNHISNISKWNTSSVTNMEGMFAHAGAFNQSLNKWNTSSVANMARMFDSVTFNQPLNNWDTSSVTNMEWMFSQADSFNQSLNNWDVSKVTNMANMFYGVNSFNQPLNNWDTSSVTNMANMFYGVNSFNQSLNNWDVSKVTNMANMFYGVNSFNQPLNNWNVSKVTNMQEMFSGRKEYWRSVANPFNQPLSSWNVSKVTNMQEMFSNAHSFNQDLSSWNVSKVTNMQEMFSNAHSFNQDLSSWKVCKVSRFSNFDFNTLLWIPKYKPVFGIPCNIDPANYYFESTWDTTKTSSGSSNSKSITLPIYHGGNYNFRVQWGDGTESWITSWNSPNKTHTYTSSGKYTLNITGQIEGFSFSNTGDRNKLINISSWGPLRFGNHGRYFKGAENLVGLPSTAPNLTGTTNFVDMFLGATSFNQPLNNWDVSKVTNMGYMFQGATSFNQPLNNWDVSKVTHMRFMFKGAKSFNQPLNNWDVSKVTNMEAMFQGATSFNQPLNNWDVSKVTNMEAMFQGATSFNQPLNNWDVSKATNMEAMFQDATSFNQPLNNWDVSKATNMEAMFQEATSFNQPLNNWDVSKVTNMANMFSGKPPLYYVRVRGKNKKSYHLYSVPTSFNQPLNNWNTSSVTNMKGMFRYADSFNQDLDNWDVSKVTNMETMFQGAKSFNQPLNNWDVSKATNMRAMFNYATSFNQPLNNWNVSKATNMEAMFQIATSFNQPLNNWDVSKATNMIAMFDFATSFNQPLNNWDVSKATNMRAMFMDVTLFNQPLNNWSTSSVTNMTNMFEYAETFNQPLNNWDVSKVTNMRAMFKGAKSFNQPLNNWDVSKVTNMRAMFEYAETFNQDLTNWNVSSVSNCLWFASNPLWTLPKPSFTCYHQGFP